MIGIKTLTESIFEYLNDNTEYAVLRNFEGLPSTNTSRDIDLVIDNNEFIKIESTIVELVEASGYFIFSYFYSEKVCTYVLGKVNDDSADFVQLDFFFNTSVFGVLLCDAKTLLQSRVFNGSVYHVNKEFEFLDKYLQLKTLNKPYPDKYSSIKEDVSESSYLHKLVGISNVSKVDELSCFQFKLKSFLGSLKIYGIQQLFLPLQFLYFHLKNTLFYTGFSLCFTGPDGAGKTSVIELLSSQLAQVYTDIRYNHYRPSLLPNLGAAAHKAKVIKEVDTNFTEPHRGAKTSITSSFIRYAYYSLDYIIGYVLKVRPVLSRRGLVIFDRYHTDILTDSKRSRIYIDFKILTFFYKVIIPKMDFTFFVTASPKVILQRKQELTEEGIIDINKKIDYLGRNIDCYVVCNEKQPSDAVFEILSIIGKHRHERYKK